MKNGTAYERLVRKVNEKRKGKEKVAKVATKRRKTEVTSVELHSQPEPMEVETNTQFLEDGNFVDMTVTEAQDREFPSEDDMSDEEFSEEENVNKNANKLNSPANSKSAQGSHTQSTSNSQGRCHGAENAMTACEQPLPNNPDGEPKENSEGLFKSITLMEKFMLKRGIKEQGIEGGRPTS